MKKFNKKDLSIHCKEIASLDPRSHGAPQDLGSQINCMTVPTNCADCHTKADCDTDTQCDTVAECSTDPIFCPGETFQTKCICLSDNCNPTMVGCADTLSQTPLCCDLPETKDTACMNPSLKCVDSVDICIKTEQNTCIQSVLNCITFNDEQTCQCLQTNISCEESDQCIIISNTCNETDGCSDISCINICIATEDCNE